MLSGAEVRRLRDESADFQREFTSSYSSAHAAPETLIAITEGAQGLFYNQEHNMVRTTAPITGASTRIGAAYAERLAQREHDLILVAWDAMKLQQVAFRIGEMTGVAIDIIPADLTSDVDRAMVEERLREDSGISILVNNAGVSSNTTILNADPDRLEDLTISTWLLSPACRWP